MDNVVELVRKLGVKAGTLVVMRNGRPEDFAAISASLPEGAQLLDDLSKDNPANIIIVWPSERDDLRDLLGNLRQAITPDGAFWIVIPRKTSGKTKSGITFAHVQTAALEIDLVDNKVAKFSDQEYGVRFVIRKEKRSLPRDE